MLPCKSTAEEISFEWSHYRISSTDSEVGTSLHVFIIDPGNESSRLTRAIFPVTILLPSSGNKYGRKYKFCNLKYNKNCQRYC